MAQPGAILNGDGSLNSEDHPAAPGSIVQIFGTGYGDETAQVYLSEQPAVGVYSVVRKISKRDAIAVRSGI